MGPFFSGLSQSLPIGTCALFAPRAPLVLNLCGLCPIVNCPFGPCVPCAFVSPLLWAQLGLELAPRFGPEGNHNWDPTKMWNTKVKLFGGKLHEPLLLLSPQGALSQEAKPKGENALPWALFVGPTGGPKPLGNQCLKGCFFGPRSPCPKTGVPPFWLFARVCNLVSDQPFLGNPRVVVESPRGCELLIESL